MAQSRLALRLAAAVRDLHHRLQDIRHPYRPELHYMRGPGPKWREKHMPAHLPAPVSAERGLAAMAKLHA